MKRLLALLLAFPLLACAADEPRLNKALNEQIVFVKNGSGVFSTELETTISKPAGDGPFPLIVINHGKEFGNPKFQPRARYIVASREFVRRGYAVMIPMRGGFAKSSGSYIEGGCNIAGNGLAQARDIAAAVAHARTLPYVDGARIVVVGQSHGGLSTMAFGTSEQPGVLGLINFAGGLKLDRCTGWESALVEAFADYGKAGRYRSLWFYGDNDSYWPKPTIDEMYARHVAAGGKARLVAFGSFKGDSHGMFSQQDGLAIWWPEVEKFLVELGLPVALLPVPPADAESQRLAEAGKVPFIADSERCRQNYQRFLDADYPRAFAVSGKGQCGYAWGGEDPKKRSLDFCRGKTETECKLYAVDDDVVWRQEKTN